MPHANASLTELGRLRLARCVVEDGWPLRRAAERFQVSHNTARRWAQRYRLLGPAGMSDRSSRPKRSPHQTPSPIVRKVLHLRVKKRWGPVRIAGRLDLVPSTVHKILTRAAVARLAWLDRATGTPIRRYEKTAPGELVHVDVKKLGNIPDGGGHWATGRARGKRNKTRHTNARTAAGTPAIGYSCLHTAIDDYSRLAYTEVLPDETKHTAAAFWTRAQAFFQAAGITVQRVLTDNGACYRSGPWRQTLANAGIAHKRTRPYRPQTNGKVERFHRTLADEWAYAKIYTSETARRAALPQWLHMYNHHRAHTALGGRPPATRVPNLCGQNT